MFILSSYHHSVEAIKLLDTGISHTCQPVFPCKYVDKLYLARN